MYTNNTIEFRVRDLEFCFHLHFQRCEIKPLSISDRILSTTGHVIGLLGYYFPAQFPAPIGTNIQGKFNFTQLKTNEILPGPGSERHGNTENRQQRNSSRSAIKLLLLKTSGGPGSSFTQQTTLCGKAQRESMIIQWIIEMESADQSRRSAE